MCVYIHAYLFILYTSICTNTSKFKYTLYILYTIYKCTYMCDISLVYVYYILLYGIYYCLVG